MKCTLKDFERFYALLEANKDKITDDHSGDMFGIAKHLLSTRAGFVLMPTDQTAFTASCINSILYEVHLLTTGKENVYADTLAATKWVKENTVIERFISHIPVDCISTISYSKNIGMEKIGIIEKGFLKNGERIDVAVVGCSVDDIIRRLSWQQR